jgi:hypothetical protein
MEYEEFKEKEVRTINVNTQGKQLLDDIIFTLSYEDELGKEYEEKKALHVKVNNVPWYGGFLNWLVNLF